MVSHAGQTARSRVSPSSGTRYTTVAPQLRQCLIGLRKITGNKPRAPEGAPLPGMERKFSASGLGRLGVLVNQAAGRVQQLAAVEAALAHVFDPLDLDLAG